MNERADFSDSENDILLAHDGSVINDDETACQLVKSDKETGVPIYYKRKLSLRVYRRRWVILVLFSLLSFMQVRFPALYSFYADVFVLLLCLLIVCCLEYLGTCFRFVIGRLSKLGSVNYRSLR